MARNFLELQQSAADDSENEAVKLLRHDGEVGITAVMNSLGDRCKCHGKDSVVFVVDVISFQHFFRIQQASREAARCKRAGKSSTTSTLRQLYFVKSIIKRSEKFCQRKHFVVQRIGSVANVSCRREQDSMANNFRPSRLVNFIMIPISSSFSISSSRRRSAPRRRAVSAVDRTIVR